jgi:hypothetical protein
MFKCKFKLNFHTLSYQLHSIQALFLLNMSQIRLEGSSSVGKVYIPSPPPPQASGNGITTFPASLKVEFCLMLKRTRNQSIFDLLWPVDQLAQFVNWLSFSGQFVNPDRLIN